MKFDAIIIGTGQAGPTLASTLAGTGKKVAVIEKGLFGGTCVNYGCTPTKAWVASARRAYVAKNSADHGITSSGQIKVDLKVIKERKDQIVATSRDGLEQFLEKNENITVFRGKGRFVANKKIAVNDQILEAENIFINVGGRPRIGTGFEGVNYMTNRDILQLDEIPKHLLVVGGGYVGLEFAQMFRRFGSQVTVIDRNEVLLKREDPDVSEIIQNVFEREGINIRLKADCLSGAQKGKEITVSLDCNIGDRKASGTHLLLATGRVPNTDDLGLENTNIETDERGFIKVNKNLETTAAGIWALGDCNGKGAFTHTAYNDHQIVVSQLLGNGSRNLESRFLCYAAYIDPPLARVGLSETEIRKQGIKALVAQRPMKYIARAKEMGETDGFLRVYIEESTKKILGAVFMGPGADECIHSVLDVMYADAPYTIIRDAVHIHPTVSELIPTLLEKTKPLN